MIIIDIFIIAFSFIIASLIITLLLGIYFNIAEKIKKSGDFSMKNPPKPPKRCYIDIIDEDIEFLKSSKKAAEAEADFYKEKYNKLLDGICFSAKRNQCGDTFSIKVDLKCQWDIECKKCQRIKELESKVKALEIELEGVI